MKYIIVMCAAYALSLPVVWAQTAQVTAKPLTDTDIQLLRSDVQSGKNQIIADTMQFTDAESTAFWPVHRDYANAQQKIGDERVQLIKDYAASYDSIDDAKASNMVQRMNNIDAETSNLRQEYWPKFMKALGARRAAKFYQVDNRLSMMVNMQLASSIPILP